MRLFVCLLAVPAAFTCLPAAAQTYVVYETQTVETSGAGYASPLEARDERRAIARFGPFVVLDNAHAALVGETDSHSPGDFAQMMAAYPHIATLEFVECPGTVDDQANLRLGRTIRQRGLAVDAPEGSSVRSGAVDLFLAGAVRHIADGAEFAVHAWMDDTGRAATDYPADAPENRQYIAYYEAMGMSAAQAQSFYAFTNSVPFADARWLTGAQMRARIAGAPSPQPASATVAGATIAYADMARQ